MGLIRLFSAPSAPGHTPVPPEPQPHRFTIQRLKPMGKHTIAWVHYPGCTTYRGNKLLVFSVPPSVIRGATLLDPHFIEGNPLSPIARFPASPEGEQHAVLLCQALGKEG